MTATPRQIRSTAPVVALACLFLGSSPSLFAQGDLVPPAGPEPTMKTLTQIEPRADLAKLTGDATAVKVISAPGSYYLTSDLAGESGKDTIRIEASAGRVMIDLNGFGLTATGAGRSAVLLPGLSVTNEMVVVRNGSITANADATTKAVGGFGTNVVCEDLKITSNGAEAIVLNADGVVDRCRIAGGGITAFDRTIVKNSVISAGGITDVSITINGSDAQVTGVSFTVNRGQIAVGDRSLVADCQIKSSGPPTSLINSTVLQTGANAVVRNCTIAAGVSTGGAIFVGSGSLVSGCRIGSVFRDGISSSPGSRVTVESCQITDFGRDGIKLGSQAIVRNCSLSGGGLNSGGIEVGDRSIVTGCTSTGNGETGISVGSNSIVRDCSATNNTGNGIVTLSNCRVEGSTSSFNAAGIVVGDGSTVAGCVTNENEGSHGISAGAGCTISACTARANTSSAASSFGINTGSSGSVTGCTVTGTLNTNATATGTTGGGINVGGGSTVKDCTVQGNKGDGIRLINSCLVAGNTCVSNGSAGDGAGIHATGGRNRIEGNNVSVNDRGIDVDGIGCVIIGNNAFGNTTNFDIVANNVFGAIVDRTAPGSAAVAGNSANSSAGTTDPHANFSH